MKLIRNYIIRRRIKKYQSKIDYISWYNKHVPRNFYLAPKPYLNAIRRLEKLLK